jgi:hypothetical protein
VELTLEPARLRARAEVDPAVDHARGQLVGNRDRRVDRPIAEQRAKQAAIDRVGRREERALALGRLRIGDRWQRGRTAEAPRHLQVPVVVPPERAVRQSGRDRRRLRDLERLLQRPVVPVDRRQLAAIAVDAERLHHLLIRGEPRDLALGRQPERGRALLQRLAAGQTAGRQQPGPDRGRSPGCLEPAIQLADERGLAHVVAGAVAGELLDPRHHRVVEQLRLLSERQRRHEAGARTGVGDRRLEDDPRPDGLHLDRRRPVRVLLVDGRPRLAAPLPARHQPLVPVARDLVQIDPQHLRPTIDQEDVLARRALVEMPAGHGPQSTRIACPDSKPRPAIGVRRGPAPAIA